MKMLKARKLLLVSVAVLSMLDAPALRAQSALDGFDPNANGAIQVVVVQPNGKILIGGDFTALAPNGGASVTRNRIARLNPDGSLDTAFNPNANGSVYAIALQADGKILVGGFFSTVGAQPRSNIARLDPITGLPDSFNPNASGGFGGLLCITVQTDGKILAGGTFTSIGGQPRNYLARLDPVTGAADAFDPNSNNWVYAVAVQAGGKILAGGLFTSIGGQTRNHMARLDPASGLADSFDPNADNNVDAIAFQVDGKILVGGLFTSIAGQTRNRIARLDPATGLADSFNPNANNAVNAIVVQTDGKILVGGAFGGANSIGGQTRNRIARLSPVTGLADSFNPDANNAVGAIALQADGKILIGGLFSSTAGVIRNHVARLESDGRLDRTLNLSAMGSFDSGVFATAVQPDGKILIGGYFDTVLGQARNNLARLNSDGTLDAFNPDPNGTIRAITVQADGKILVGGFFSFIGGQFRNYIARLDGTTGLADSFDPDADNGVFSITVQSDGRILVGGQFLTIGGATRRGIAQLNPATGLADSWNANANGPVNAIAVAPNGKILVGGNFSGANSIGGQTRNRIARLDPNTGLADAFNPNASDIVNALALQSDGKILVGGAFATIGGQTRNLLARLDPVTGLADSFNPNGSGGSSTPEVRTIAPQTNGRILVGGAFGTMGGQTRNNIARLDPITGLADSFNPNADDSVHGLALQSDGKILVGGRFGAINGQTRNLFARVTNDAIVEQNIVVSQTAVTWSRDGASPQFARVTFEDSSNGVNYNFLGNATASGNDWTLSGLNLSPGQNLYIRARGYHRGGILNGSGSIIENVRNAFITAPLQLSTAVSRKTHGSAGTFDVPLPLTGEPGVECRSTGGGHTLVFTFSNDVVSGNASITNGTGTVSGSPVFAGNTMTVNLTGVADVQKITVTLNAVTDSSAQILPDTAVSVNMLIGDTNGNKSVSASDVAQTKAQSGAVVTSANFRTDINVSGTLTASDVAQVKANSGHTLP